MKTLSPSFPFSKVRITPFIPAAIVFWRHVRNMTQETLAEAAGLSLSAIQRIELGQKRGGWFGTVEEICMALGITIILLAEVAAQMAAGGTIFVLSQKSLIVAS